MDLLFRHFALAGIAVVVINAVIARNRIGALAAAQGIDAREASRLIRRVAAWLIGMFALQEVLTVASGASSPICFLPVPHPADAWQYVAWGLWAGWGLGVTAWVWAGGGAEALARYGPLFARHFEAGKVYKASTVRLLVLAWCIGSLAVPLLMPAGPAPMLGCP